MKSWDGPVDTADLLPVVIVTSMARVEPIVVRSSQIFPIPPKLSGDYESTSAREPVLPHLPTHGEEKTVRILTCPGSRSTMNSALGKRFPINKIGHRRPRRKGQPLAEGNNMRNEKMLRYEIQI